MAYKTFVAGDVLTATELNDYLMNQSVMVFTNATARDTALTSPTEGMFAYLTASDHLTIYNGSAWVITDTSWNSYTPTLYGFTQGTGATTQAYYARIGKTVVVQGYITMGTTAPTFTSQMQISLPVDQASSNRSSSVGTAFMRDVSGAASYLGSIYLTSTPGRISFQAVNASGTYATLSNVTGTVPFTWALDDYFSFTVTYQGV